MEERIPPHSIEAEEVCVVRGPRRSFQGRAPGRGGDSKGWRFLRQQPQGNIRGYPGSLQAKRSGGRVDRARRS